MKTGLLVVIALLLGGILAFMVISQRQAQQQDQRDREMAACAAKFAYDWKTASLVVSMCLFQEYDWGIVEASNAAEAKFPN